MPWQEALKQRQAFMRVRNAERDYSRKLVRVANHIGDMVKEMATPDVDLAHLETVLRRYSGILEPWARAVAQRFLSEVSRRDSNAWSIYARQFSRALELELRTAPTGEMMRRFLETQVQLITSLPLKAAERVHETVMSNLVSGERYGELIDQIMDTGEVTRSRAKLIARTETARVSSALVMTRAQHIGSDGYIWRTMRDQNVRPAIGSRHFAEMNTLMKGSHRKLEGTFHRWDDPPIAGPNGQRAHAGMIFACRCYPEVVIPERYR